MATKYTILKSRKVGRPYEGPDSDRRFTSLARGHRTLDAAVAEAVEHGLTTFVVIETVPDLATDEPLCVRKVAEHHITVTMP